MALENGEKNLLSLSCGDYIIGDRSVGEIWEKWTKNGATVSRHSLGEYIRREPGFL